MSLPLLSLCSDAQLSILTKMENSEVAHIAMTCTKAKFLIDANEKAFSSRHEYGDRIVVEVTKDKILVKNYRTGSETRRDVVSIESSEAHMSTAMSLSIIDINFMEDSNGAHLLEYLRKWRPSCKKVLCHGFIPSAALGDVFDNIRCSFFVISNVSRDPEFRTNLTTLRKTHQNLTIRDLIHISTIEDGLTDDIRISNGFRVVTDAQSINRFLWDLVNSKDSGNLIAFDFVFPGFTNASLWASAPPSTPLFIDPLPSHTRNPVTIRKFPFAKEKCLLVTECCHLQQNNMHTVVTCSVVEDDDDAVLDFVIMALGIKKSFFSKEERARYFAGSSEFRVYHLLHVRHVQLL